MKRTKDLHIRSKLSKMRQTLRQQLNALGLEAERLQGKVFLSAEERQLAGERLKRLIALQTKLQEELNNLTRGSRSQIAAGWQ